MDENKTRFEELYNRYYGYESEGIFNMDKRSFLADISITLAMIYDELRKKNED